MVKRVFDIFTSSLAIVILSPLFVTVALAIRVSSKGPVLYRSVRAGYQGIPFTMLKLRTMHTDHGKFKSLITAKEDKRIFPIGKKLRELKLDELPQLFNVLKGDMSIIGPRPEDPKIVEDHYTAFDKETLEIKPGLASPGSIYNYTHGDEFLAGYNHEKTYIDILMPIKLALDVVYSRQTSFFYDMRLIYRTVVAITGRLTGKKSFPCPPEMETALSLLKQRKPYINNAQQMKTV